MYVRKKKKRMNIRNIKPETLRIIAESVCVYYLLVRVLNYVTVHVYYILNSFDNDYTDVSTYRHYNAKRNEGSKAQSVITRAKKKSSVSFSILVCVCPADYPRADEHFFFFFLYL